MSKDGKLCFEGLIGEWSPSISITQIISAIVVLLKEPKFDVPLNTDAAKVYKASKK